LEAVVTAKRDKAAALKLLKRIMKRYGAPRSIVTDGLRAYSAAMNEIGVAAERREVGGRLNNRAENSHQPFRRRERAMQRFRSPKRFRSSAQFMPRCTTNSISSAISSRGKSTSKGALLPWPSGALSQHRSSLARWRSRCLSTSLRYFDTAVAVLFEPRLSSTMMSPTSAQRENLLDISREKVCAAPSTSANGRWPCRSGVNFNDFCY
jgi:DDE domain